MPNWCFTEVRIHSENKETLAELNSKMEELENMKEPLVENDFGKRWLGCLVTALGGDPDECEARGEWNSRTFDGKEIQYQAQEAWAHKYLVDLLIMEKYPDLKISFYMEECGCECYLTNDPERFPYCIIIDTDKEGEEYFRNEKEALAELNRLYSQNFKSLDEAESFEDENDDTWISVNEVDVDVNIYEKIRTELKKNHIETLIRKKG